MFASPPVPNIDSVAALVAAHPVAMRVLKRHHISVYDRNPRPLESACAAAGIPVDSLLAEVAGEELAAGPEWDWSQSSLATIIAEIIERWHRPLEEELPRLQGMAEALARTFPYAPFPELAGVVAALHDDLGPHALLVECVIFPMILDGEGHLAIGRFLRVEEEHAYTLELVARMRELTHDYHIPTYASATQRALWTALEALESDLTDHVAVEMDVLKPRAGSGEDPHHGWTHASAARHRRPIYDAEVVTEPFATH